MLLLDWIYIAEKSSCIIVKEYELLILSHLKNNFKILSEGKI